jgi:hypothetical protein
MLATTPVGAMAAVTAVASVRAGVGDAVTRRDGIRVVEFLDFPGVDVFVLMALLAYG